MEAQRHIKRFTGRVLKDGNDKTIVVGVNWSQKHRLYQKRFRRLTKLVAHDEGNIAKTGDMVVIESARPTSATKRWRLIRTVSGNAGGATQANAAASPEGRSQDEEADK